MLYCGWTYLPLVAKPTVVGYKLNIILIYGILSGMLYIRVYLYIYHYISNYVLWYTCIIQVEWYSISNHNISTSSLATHQRSVVCAEHGEGSRGFAGHHLVSMLRHGTVKRHGKTWGISEKTCGNTWEKRWMYIKIYGCINWMYELDVWTGCMNWMHSRCI